MGGCVVCLGWLFECLWGVGVGVCMCVVIGAWAR